MAAPRRPPPQAKEVHPSVLPEPQTPWWRRSLALKKRKNSEDSTRTVDSGVAGFSTPPSPARRVSIFEDEVIADIRGLFETTNFDELPQYTDGNSSAQVRVSYREVEVSFWSRDAWVSDDENLGRKTYNDQVIPDTLGEVMRDRLQNFREHNSFFLKREEKKKGKRLALLRAHAHKDIDQS